MDPRVISLDIESSGLVKGGKQTTFHPEKIRHIDGGSPSDFCVSICLTIPTEDPRLWTTPPVVTDRWSSCTTPRYRPSPTSSADSSTSASWSLWQIAGLSPGRTMHLDPANPRHLTILARWLAHCDTLVGQNLKYDLLMLRAYSPLLRRLLCGRHTIIDLSVVNFLHSENRPERSLKNLGPVLRTHVYAADTLDTYNEDGKKYTSAADPDLISHNAQDTHNTLLSIRELARRIIRDYGVTAKMSPFCTAFFSETTWTCLFMEESGLCFSRRRLEALETRSLRRSRDIARILKPLVELTPGTKDIKKSQAAFLEDCIAAITASGVDIRSHPSLSLTEKKKDVSFNEENFNLFRLHLPRSHPLARACRLIVRQKYKEKLVSTYTYPLLRGTRPTSGPGKKKVVRDQVAIPLPTNPLLGITYPSWFITPSAIKDDTGTSGGTKQSRITCKGPAVQTFPPPIKECQHTRHPLGVRVGLDLKQIELKVATLCSGEPSMLTEYAKELTGGKPDLHQQMAVSIFGPQVLDDPHWKDGTWEDPRQWGGKTPNFLILYRGGPDKYQQAVLRDSGRLLDMPLCTRVVTGAKAARPVLWAWQDTRIAEARRLGYLSLPLTGHTRTFLPGQKWDENEICNFDGQSIAGLTQLAFQHTLYRALAPFTTDDGPIALMESNVYDAVYFDLRSRADLPHFKDICNEAIRHQEENGYWGALQAHYQRRVPLSFDLKEINPSSD